MRYIDYGLSTRTSLVRKGGKKIKTMVDDERDNHIGEGVGRFLTDKQLGHDHMGIFKLENPIFSYLKNFQEYLQL